MKTPFRARFSLPLFGILALAITSPAARATLLVYEGFNGYGGANISGVTPNANTVGLNQSVGYTSTNNPAGFTNSASSLALGNLATSGGSVSFAGGTNVAGAQLSLGSSPYTGTLYSSYLINLTAMGTGGGNGFEVRLNNDTGSASARLRSFADTRTGTSNVPGVDYDTAGTGGIVDSPGGALATGTTYLMISSYTNVGVSIGGSTGLTGVGSSYALSTAQFAYMMTLSDQEGFLVSATIGTGADQVTARATEFASPATAGTFSFANGNNMQFVAVGETGTLDEIRWGTTLGDVIPLIPEPSTLALAALAGAGLIVRRRRVIADD